MSPVTQKHAFTRRGLLQALMLAPLGACALPPPKPNFPIISYRHLPPLQLDVGRVDIGQSYSAKAAPPAVDHLFPVAPAAAAARWAEDRLRAVGSIRRAEYWVREAEVLEVSLETQEGLEGAFTNEQAERYEASLVVDLIILDGQLEEARAQAKAWRSTTVPEDTSLRQREEAWHQMTQALMADFNREMERLLKNDLAPYRVI